jgi:hypothetical protein
MFRKVLQSISRSLSSKPKADASARRVSSGSILERVAGQPPVRPVAATAHASAESLCGITPKMSKEEVSAQIKLLYRRYNRAASSLDVNVRAEAERMLDAIVEVREKRIGPI